MKKIFWTSIVWIALVVLFWAYVRLFNSGLGAVVSAWIYQDRVVIQTSAEEPSADMLIINDQLTKINDKLQNILENLSGQKDSTSSAATPPTPPALPNNFYLNK